MGGVSRRLGGVYAGQGPVEELPLVRAEIRQLQQVVDEDAHSERGRDTTRRGVGLVDQPHLVQLGQTIAHAGRREGTRHPMRERLGSDRPRLTDIGRDERPQHHRLALAELAIDRCSADLGPHSRRPW